MDKHTYTTGNYTKQGTVQLRVDICNKCGCKRYVRKDQESTSVTSYELNGNPHSKYEEPVCIKIKK